jgi:integrase
MTRSRASNANLVDGIGRQLKSQKGKVKVENDKGWLRLRFTHLGKRYAFALGYPDTVIGWKLAESKAQQIELDILSYNFDPTLAKYKPQRQVSSHQPDALSVAGLFQQFMDYKAKSLSAKTMEKYRATYNYLLKFFPNKAIASVTESSAEEFVKWQFGKSLSPDQVKRRMEELEACWLWHQVEQNPWKVVGDSLSETLRERIKVPPKQKPKPFTREEMQISLEGFGGDRHYKHYLNFVEFLFGTGCRIGEAIGLRWKHITDDCSQVWIGEQITRGNRKATKTNRARTVTLTPKLQQMLQSRRPAHPAPEALVFTAPKGGAMDDHNFRNRPWKKMITKLGIDYRKPYNTRHTLVSHALDLQMNPVMVAELTRHNVKTLYEHYAGNVNSRPTLPEL